MENTHCSTKTGHLLLLMAKQWVHTESEDLVHFHETNVELRPDTKNDSHGAYSGSVQSTANSSYFIGKCPR